MCVLRATLCQKRYLSNVQESLGHNTLSLDQPEGALKQLVTDTLRPTGATLLGLASVSGHEDLFIDPIRPKCTSGPVNGYPGSNFNLTCENCFTNLQKGVSFEGRFNLALSSR